jgi:hypothetical protein
VLYELPLNKNALKKKKKERKKRKTKPKVLLGKLPHHRLGHCNPSDFLEMA